MKSFTELYSLPICDKVEHVLGKGFKYTPFRVVTVRELNSLAHNTILDLFIFTAIMVDCNTILGAIHCIGT